MNSFVEHILTIDDHTHKAYYDISLIMLQNKTMRDDFEDDDVLA